MANPRSPHSHGRSELHERPGFQRALRRERARLGLHLRQLRYDRGLNQDRAAEAIGIHPVHLQRLESGSANVTLATLLALSIAYRVSLHTLFEHEEDGSPRKGAVKSPKR